MASVSVDGTKEGFMMASHEMTMHAGRILLAAAMTVTACAAKVGDDIAQPVRPGCTAKGIPFWNGHATFFRYAPAFGFKEVPQAVRYRFSLRGNGGEKVSFEAGSPEAPFSPIWNNLANRQWTVVCEGINTDGNVIGVAGERIFVKTAPFTGGYVPAARPYREAARMIYEYMTALPGVLDGVRGMKFINAVCDSSEQGNVWKKI